MSRSTLSIRISIAQLVEKLTDDDCLSVIRLLQNELGVSTLNAMVNHVITNFAQSLTDESLIRIQETITDIYSSSSENNKICTSKNNKTASDTILFPLRGLPDDLIIKTSLFLNEKDILQFEQCCRLFYKMINNKSYLAKCNNFKEFTLTKRRLSQMRQCEYSFFKFSKATRLTSHLNTRKYRDDDETNKRNLDELLVASVNDFKTTMNHIYAQKTASYDDWWTSLCKSILILDFGCNTNIGALLSQMPIEILFNPDPHESHLKIIELNHYFIRDGATVYNNYMNEFEEKYLKCKKKWEQQGLKIKSLQCIKHTKLRRRSYLSLINPRYIHSKHVWINNMQIDLTDNRFLTNLILR